MTGSRRHFLKMAGAAIASSVLGPLGLMTSGCSDAASQIPGVASGATQPPNILLILTDQFRLPPDGYGLNQGEAPGVREILRFENSLSAGNPFTQFFPGMLRLRQNAVVLRRHHIASAACAPSRSSFLTGQYPSLHGVTQTDGMFKDVTEVKFLDPQGVPTLGDWFQAAGYSAYYFGKWHCSEVDPPYDLSPWGFAGWETSGPEPHGSDPNNLGAHRDPQFSSIVDNFLKTQGTMPSDKPWFAVASFVNPHDVAAYPFPFYGPRGVTPLQALPNVPQPVPAKDTLSNPDPDGNIVNLNPGGFPQACFDLPPTAKEDLSSKPTCQIDAAYKVQLALQSLWPAIVWPINPYPVQTQPTDAWSLAFGQFYVYLHYLVDLELQKLLATFDKAGLSKNTIIIFTSDHGEHGLCHGQMLQKWYTAYNEAVRVPFVVSSPLVNASADTLKEVSVPTSHIDLAPTLLGLAGFHGTQISQIQKLITGHTQVRDLVGADLSSLIAGGGTPPVRSGVLFAGADDVTALPEGVATPLKQSQYDLFLKDVQAQIIMGSPLQPGPVIQPNCIHMLSASDFKLNRYYDPARVAADQWEFYSLVSDPTESFNLVDFQTGLLRASAAVPGLSTAQLQARLDLMKADLALQEQQQLLKPV